MASSDESESCVKCQKTFKSTEIVLVCGLWCRKSFHNACVGLSINEAHAVTWSKERIKFHCEACEIRLGIELYGEAHGSKKLENYINSCILDLVQNLLKLTNKLSKDNSIINTKLDTVLSSNARLEEALLQSPRCAENRSEEASDNSVEYVESVSAKRTTEISELNEETNSHNQTVNSKQMECCASEIQPADNSTLQITSVLPKQLADSEQQNTAEGCSSNCLQEWEVSDGHVDLQDPLSINKECMQAWEMPDDTCGTQDPLSVNREGCSPSEEFLISSEFSIEKRENEEDEAEAVKVSEVDREGCSSSEDFLEPSTFTMVKIEHKEEDEAVREDNLKESQHEVKSTSNGSEVESTPPVHMKDRGVLDSNISLTTGTGSRVQPTAKQETSCGNEIGTRHLGDTRSICKETFAQLQELNKHKHVNRSDLLPSCSVCHKTFVDNSNLKRHFRIHTGERPYICGICNKTFKQSCHLQQHSKVHTGERPYVCGVCNKAFKYIANLREHCIYHTGERPFVCGVCNKGFVKSTHLKRHSKSHTSEYQVLYHLQQDIQSKESPQPALELAR